MRSNIVTIISKEFARFFKDARMVFMTLFLPAVLIYAVYSLMGAAMIGMFTPDDDVPPVIYVVSMPQSETMHIKLEQFELLPYTAADMASVPEVKAAITRREVDLLVIFPPDFDASVAGFDTRPAGVPAPNVEMYFNALEANSMDAFSRFGALLDMYHNTLANVFDVNRDVLSPSLATDEEVSASLIAMLLPMLLLTFLYSGCVGLAPESIAGEKERGTIATLLVTPLKRRELAAGKILSLAALSFLSAVITTLATILAMPNLMGDDVVATGIYGAVDYALLMGVILSTVLLLVTIISIISALSKSVKEAGTAVAPLMIVVMVVGVMGMFGGAREELIFYLIPLYSSVQSMSGIFSLDYSAANIVTAIFSNLAFAVIGGIVLTKMFNSEKVMFSK